MYTVTIIGGGFCGTLTAVQLMDRAVCPLRIVIINSKYPLCRGVAYSTWSRRQLLNVPAGNMSAFPDRRSHFLEWLGERHEYRDIDKALLGSSFIPRTLYGEYLEQVFLSAKKRSEERIRVDNICDEAIDLVSIGEKWEVIVKNGAPVSSDAVVIATGNRAPRNPFIGNTVFFQSKRYFQNPWTQDVVSDLGEGDIVILGNGLTMVDTCQALYEKGFRKRIYSISQHGFSLMPHSAGEPNFIKIVDKLALPYRLQDILGILNKDIKLLNRLGKHSLSLIDALRPHTHEIWQSFTEREKALFFKHLRYLWDTARHRLPGGVHHTVSNWILSGKLIPCKGIVNDIHEAAGRIEVLYTNDRRQPEKLRCTRVINCTGPEMDLSANDNLLLNRLCKKGLLTAGPLRLGVKADVGDYNIIDRDGNKIDTIFVLGGNLKGMLWESTAVPELRVQAEKVAENILAMACNTLNYEVVCLETI